MDTVSTVTLCAAILAYLQSDAGARDDRANRDNKRYALEAFGRQVSGNAEVNYAYNSAYQNWQELDLLAASAANQGDDAAARRYTILRDQMLPVSPLLNAPYFDAATGEVALPRYEVDTYLVAVTALQEAFLASSTVKDAWDAKANTYIVHLTLLAVALFLLGLSLVTNGRATRWIFTSAGSAIALVALLWAGQVYAQPVVDLRAQGNAIRDYAQGVGFAYQGKCALQASPGELWIQADLALSLLAAGQPDQAKAEYGNGMKLATEQVAAALAAGAEPPSYLWWGLDDAANGLDDLIAVLDGDESAPPLDKLTNGDTLRTTATAIIHRSDQKPGRCPRICWPTADSAVDGPDFAL